MLSPIKIMDSHNFGLVKLHKYDPAFISPVFTFYVQPTVVEIHRELRPVI